MAWTKVIPAHPVVAVAGATGAVGNEFLKVLHDLNFPASEVRALASARSAGKKLPFEGCGDVPAGELTVQEMTPESFEGVDIALFSAGSDVSKAMREAVVAAGAVMIDNSSAFRMDEDVPLVVPEVNPDDVSWHSGVIANPNCSTIQMVVALKPLYDLAKITRVVVSTYQAAPAHPPWPSSTTRRASFWVARPTTSSRCRRSSTASPSTASRTSTSSSTTTPRRKSGRWSPRRRRLWAMRA